MPLQGSFHYRKSPKHICSWIYAHIKRYEKCIVVFEDFNARNKLQTFGAFDKHMKKIAHLECTNLKGCNFCL